MNKDVIYIDVEDDITAIIGKIKKSKEKIIALVPPKHVGVLQSAVNLRLLDRMAKADKKHLVLISNNAALIALSASAHIPVARNLQSKPEIAEIPALSVDDDDDIIDGSELPVGDHAKSVEDDDSKKSSRKTDTSSSLSALKRKPSRDDTLETLAIDGESVEIAAASEVASEGVKKAANARSKVKIPNFNSFRKRLFLGILAAVVLTGLLIWMFVIAPAATITITASTTPAPVSATVRLGGTATTDTKVGVISSESQQLKKDATIQFTATGQKDIGTKATGNVKFSKLSQTDTDVPSGTVLQTSDGLNFITQADATIPASVPCFPTYCAQSTTVAVQADNGGTKYNGESGSLSGAPSGVSASFTAATSGGTTNVVAVVSDNDIQVALGQLQGQSTDVAKKSVEAQFKNGEVVIDGSFTADAGTPTSSPASGVQVGSDGKATLTIPMTYTVQAFPKADLENYLTANLTGQITNADSQRIYDDGLSKVGFSNFVKNSDGTMTVNVTTTGEIGPKIDETAVKNLVRGKITGDVQSALSGISGVESVDVQYSYFWVKTVPTDSNKIDIQFKLQNAS